MTMKALCVLCAIDGTRQAQAGAGGLSKRAGPAAYYLAGMRIHS